MKYKIFDTHAHYDDEAFDEDRNNVIEEIKKNGVIGVLNCGASMEGARQSVKLANENEFFYAAVGIHPSHADELTSDNLNNLEILASNEKVKAIGEIGLDYYWDENPDKEVQKNTFRKQMELAEKLGLPVVIHDRDAHADTLEIMKEFPNVIGVVHCFSGSVEFARECVKLGYYIGFTGVITFKNAKKIIEVCEDISLERILVETDCPYMAPTPYRGKRNQSNYIEYMIEKIAEIKGVNPVKLNEILLDNTKDIFNIDSL